MQCFTCVTKKIIFLLFAAIWIPLHPYAHKKQQPLFIKTTNNKGILGISSEIQEKAYSRFYWLDSLAADLFNTKKLTNPLAIRESLLNPFGYAGKTVVIPRTFSKRKKHTKDLIQCMHFNRGKKKLVIIGAGFGNEKEMVAPLIPLFMENHDIVIFDQLGHGYGKKRFSIARKSLEILLRNQFPTICCKETKLGNHEDADVFKVVSFFRKQKQYDEIHGICFCFSGLVFTKAAARAEQVGIKLFDKLILDSCLLSPQSAIDQVVHDPKLMFSPQRGGWENKTIVKNKRFKKWLRKRLQKVFKNAGDISNLNTANYIKHLKDTHILFFHSQTDLMVPYKDFEKIWNAATTPYKTAIITRNSHLTNHIKNKEMYAYVANRFFQKPFDKFINSIK